MRSTKLGLALGLLGGVAIGGAALAQTPPAPAPKPPATSPAPGLTPPSPAAPAAPAQAAPQVPPAPQGQAGAQNGQPPIPTPGGPPEGMVVETPNGFYLVRPGDQNPQRLDLGRGGQPGMNQSGMNQSGMNQSGMNQSGMGQPGADGPRPGRGPAAMAGDDDGAMGDMADDMQPPPPRPRRPPPRPPEGKGARLHVHAPNLDVNVKCPDDEPIKACVDAVAQLMDKANAAAH